MTTKPAPPSSPAENFRDGFILLGLEAKLTSAKMDRHVSQNVGGFAIYSAYTPGTIISNSCSSYPENPNAKLD